MPGFYDYTPISLGNVTSIGTNLTSPADFLARVNYVVFDGWLFFVLLLTIYFILYLSFQSKSNQPLNNLLYASVITCALSFLLRGITVAYAGLTIGLLSDLQMWLFTVWTALLSSFIWAIKD